MVQELKSKVLSGDVISREEALRLQDENLEELCLCADEIRRHFCGDAFDICTIINGKSGKCSEDCKYCAQSAHYRGLSQEYDLLEISEMKRQALYNESKGILRYSVVTSGKTLNEKETLAMEAAYQAIGQSSSISLCASHGLLNYQQLKRLKNAGVLRYHNNLETSRRYFPQVCTTHTYDEKIQTIQAAKKAGLEVCSGGIMGLGETMEDRIDMALELRALDIRSVPVNMLNPIPGTPYENHEKLTSEEMRRILAIYRFLLPQASLRLAGGRGLLEDKGRSCFLSGANAAISGDMLTTAGIDIQSDMQMLEELGYRTVRCHG